MKAFILDRYGASCERWPSWSTRALALRKVARTPEMRAIAERLGADATVDYMAPGWAENERGLT